MTDRADQVNTEPDVRQSMTLDTGSQPSVLLTQPQVFLPDEPDQVLKKFIESDAGDGTNREDHYLHGFKLVFCIISIFLCVFLIALDQTIVATLITKVGNQFNSFQNIGWLSSGFLLTMAVFIQPIGKLSIIFGRRNTMIVSIVLFEAGSLMCALAPSMNVLIGGRVLAGIGAAGIQGGAFVVIAEIVPIEKRPACMAVIGCCFAVASVLGPLLGGAFTEHVTWRWSFYINLPIGGVALACFIFAFKQPKIEGKIWPKLKKFDFLGTFLIVSGSVVFLLALTFGGNEFRWDSAPVILCFVLGGLTMIAFCVWNFGFSKDPLIATDIVASRHIMAATLVMSGCFGSFISFMIYGAVYFQVIWGSSPLSSGLHLLPTIVSVVLTSISSGIIIQKLCYIKPFSIAAGVLAPIGGGLITLLDVDSSFAQRVGLLIITGVATGASLQAGIMSSQVSAPKTPGGTIMTTTFVNFSRSFFAAVAAELASTVYSSSLTNIYPKAIAKETNQALLQELSKFTVEQLISSTAILDTLSPEAELFVKQQIMDSIRNVFYMGLGFSCVSTLACFFTTNERLPKLSGGASSEKAGEKEGNGTEAEAIENLDKEIHDLESSDTISSEIEPKHKNL